MPLLRHPDLLVGAETGDDAAVYRLNDDTALILTVDFFPPITDDPYEFGAIAAANSLSDVYAMGGKPLLALNVVGFPAALDKAILGRTLQGGYAKAEEAGCLIVGGHTVDDPEPKYGLSVIGVVKPGQQVSNAGARPGDALVLSKPLGTGIITTAGKQGTADAAAMAGAVATMAALNRPAAAAMMQVGVNAATDITGFGLLGHLQSMVKGSGVAATVSRSAVPVLPGAAALLARGIVPGGTHRNVSSVTASVSWDAGLSEDDRLLLCDAQTSGGLLMATPAARADALQAALLAEGAPCAAIVGYITDGAAGTISVTP